ATSGRTIDPDNYSPRTLAHDMALHKRLPLEDCRRIGTSIASALSFLHQHGLVHRDVKPSNIIFVGGVPKLADIGLVAGVDDARSFVGPNRPPTSLPAPIASTCSNSTRSSTVPAHLVRANVMRMQKRC